MSEDKTKKKKGTVQPADEHASSEPIRPQDEHASSEPAFTTQDEHASSPKPQ